MRSVSARLCAATASAAIAMVITMVPPAAAATAPVLACGTTQPGPCQETVHFSDINDMNSPAPPGGGCPAALASDFFTFVGSGQGVEHTNVNKAQDGWFTTTFTGTVTITAYLHGTVDTDGNVTGVDTPDTAFGPLTGKITEWFGGSFNKQSSVFHGTINLTLTDSAGKSLGVHFTTHASWTPGTDPNGPPHTSFDKITCH